MINIAANKLLKVDSAKSAQFFRAKIWTHCAPPFSRVLCVLGVPGIDPKLTLQCDWVTAEKQLNELLEIS